MNKENVDPVASSLKKIILPTSRQVPAILRRRRTAHTTAIPDMPRNPSIASPLQARSIAASPQQNRPIPSPFKPQSDPSDRSPSNMQYPPKSSRAAASDYRETAVQLVPVLQTANKHLQVARKRHYQLLINSTERSEIDKSGNQYQRGDSAHKSRKRAKWEETASLGEVSRRNVTLARGYEIARGLQQLVAGTSQVLKYLLEQAEEESRRSNTKPQDAL